MSADAAAGDDRRRRHRHRAEAIHDAALDVGGDDGHRVADPERHGHGEEAGHQEVAVVAAARDDHAAAEDVAEQQHEHDREQQLADDRATG